MKMKSRDTGLLTLLIVACAAMTTGGAGAQEPLDSIRNAPDAEAAGRSLESSFRDYSQAGRFNDFIDMLGSVRPRNKETAGYVDYYAALARYRQLRFLEEKQLWDEYFERGNEYRAEIVSRLESALKNVSKEEKIYVLSRLLAWKFHRDQQDPSQESALKGLMQSASAYAKAGEAEVIKTVADELSEAGEKGAARDFYRMYLEKSVSVQSSPQEIFARADEFAGAGNRDLEENLFELYWEKALSKMPKESRIPVTREIALRFSGSPEGAEGAERFFARLEEAGGSEVFDENLLYLRAGGLLSLSSPEKARELYETVAGRFPQSLLAGSSLLKSGVISLFFIHDAEKAAASLEKAVTLEGSNESAQARYYRGLLEHWMGNATQAREWYAAAMAQAPETETGKRAARRMEEIDNELPLDQPLRLLLDLASGKETAMGNLSRVTLKPSAPNPGVGEEVLFTVESLVPQSGCTQMVLEYFWPLDTGSGSAAPTEEVLKTTFAERGTKAVAVVVQTPQGALDRGIIFVDVQ